MSGLDQSKSPNSGSTNSLLRGGALLAATVTAIGFLVVCGWVFEIEYLKRLMVGYVAMNPTTAVGLMLAGYTLCAQCVATRQTWPKHMGLCAAAIVIAIGLLRLARLGLGIGPAVDQWFLPSNAAESLGIRNGMAPNTALLFVILGSALCLLSSRRLRRIWIPEVLTLVGIAMSIVALSGYLYGVGRLYGVGTFIPMALPTAVAFALLGLGTLLACPSQYVLSRILSSRPGGVILRRAIPGSAIIVFGVGLLRLLGEKQGVFTIETGVALMSSVTFMLMVSLAVVVAGRLDKTDAERDAIAERARVVQEEVRLNHELLQAILSNIADGVVVTNRSGEILHSNVAAVQILGGGDDRLAIQWLGGESLRKGEGTMPFPPQELALVQASQGKTVLDQDQYLRGDPGHTGKWLSVSAQPLGAAADGAAVLIIRDITPRKLAELKLEDANDVLEAMVTERTADLSRSNQDLQQFAYVASHDLQEPLRMVGSFLQLLERRYKDTLDDQGREFIAFAVDGANRMKQLINDLLQYSRVGSRGGTFGEVEASDVLEDVRRAFGANLLDTNTELSVGVLPRVIADSSQLRQVFQNLIGNAIKFRGSDPPRISVQAETEGTMCLFCVSDNGIGIDPQYAETIFEVFQRLHTREQYPGTGIGLAICKKVVERHGGRIWVERRDGGGSVFKFTIPMKGVIHEQRAAA